MSQEGCPGPASLHYAWNDLECARIGSALRGVAEYQAYPIEAVRKRWRDGDGGLSVGSAGIECDRADRGPHSVEPDTRGRCGEAHALQRHLPTCRQSSPHLGVTVESHGVTVKESGALVRPFTVALTSACGPASSSAGKVTMTDDADGGEAGWSATA